MYKRILAAAIIIIIAFIYVEWGMDYIYAYEWDKTAPDRESLVTDVANLKKITGKPVTIDEMLVQKVADLQAQVDKETALFPASENVDITAAVDNLLHLAQNAGIGIIPLRNGDWSNSPETGYQMYQTHLLISGDVDHIMSFVKKVEETMPYSVKIDALDMSGKAIGPAVSTNGTGDVDGYITVVIYGR